MSTTQLSKKYTQKEYLELERIAIEKSAYFKGDIFPMSGASLLHNKLTVNFISLLGVKLKGSGCYPLGSDMRIHIPANTLNTYPDILVVRDGKEELLDQHFDTLLNPIFKAEVLSPFTADYDTGGKFILYRSIPSLKEYWAVSSYDYRLLKFVKNEANNTWILSETSSPGDTITLDALDLSVSMAELYEGVSFQN